MFERSPLRKSFFFEGKRRASWWAKSSLVGKVQITLLAGWIVPGDQRVGATSVKLFEEACRSKTIPDRWGKKSRQSRSVRLKEQCPKYLVRWADMLSLSLGKGIRVKFVEDGNGEKCQFPDLCSLAHVKSKGNSLYLLSCTTVLKSSLNLLEAQHASLPKEGFNILDEGARKYDRQHRGWMLIGTSEKGDQNTGISHLQTVAQKSCGRCCQVGMTALK